MPEYEFQDLCCELFEQEQGISSCEVYGRRGEAQLGIDLLARTSGAGIEVGQCKCYQHFPAAEIRRASEAFFAHWDFWSTQHVSRFVLLVACDLSSTHQQNEITRQTRAFDEKDIRYEAWSARQIAKKLRPHRAIAATYIPEQWVDRICGPLTAASPPPSQTQLSIVNEALVRYVESLQSLVSRTVSTELEVIRTAWREGRTTETLNRLESLVGERSLPAPARSELLVLAARIELDRQDPDAARRFLAQLPASTPSALRVTALIEYRATRSPDRALELLSRLDDLASRQLTTAILLENGRLEAAALLLRDLSAAAPADPETLRLAAFLHLLEGHPDQAQLAIAEALEIAPRWATLRWAAGMIAYYHSVSPALLRLQLTAWPEPLNWQLVRRDDTTATRLAEAARHFHDLLATTEPPPDERRRLETWHLASLANNPETQVEAETYCRELLRDQPTHAPAILWAVARRFDLDLRPPRRALDTLIREQRAEYEHVVALAAIYLTHKQHRKALALLDRERQRFEQAQAPRLWAYWRALALASSKQDVSSFLDELEDAAGSFEVRQARAVALREQAAATGDPQPLLRHLTESFDATSDPAFLFAACAVAAEHSDWAFVASRREALLELVGTPDALRLAAFSAFHTHDYLTCRELLDGRRDLFRHGRLPTDLRELRVLAARRLGALPDAVAQAESLAQDEPTTQHLVNLASVYLDSGDLRALALTARGLLGRSDLESREALRLARLVYLEDPPLAQSLWRQATAAPLPDALVGEVFETASRLGLGRETRPWVERLTHLARTQQAGVRGGGLPDLRQVLADHRRLLEAVDDAYSRAAIPIHIVSAETGIPLADLFHALLADNERDPRPLAQGFLLIRHGGRPLGEFSQAPRWRLHLDVTAVLLAAHLDLLDRVESAFRPLRIPDDLVPALLEMRDALAPAQPDHLAASEAVVELLDSRLLKLLPDVPEAANSTLAGLSSTLGPDSFELLAAAVATDGAFVQFLPLTDRDLAPVVLPPALVARVSGIRSLLDALRESGAISPDRFAEVLADLGPSEAEHPGAPLPGMSLPLYCARGIAGRLARLGALDTFCRTFQMHLHPREAEHLRAELRAARRAASTTTWVTALIERIRQGIASGTYEVIVAPEPPPEEPATPPTLRNHTFGCLQTLLLCPLAPGDVLWIDDRWASSYVARDEAPIVGVNEVLRALLAAGALEPDEYHAKLARLRAANLHFIPIAAEELVHHLAGYQSDESGSFAETHELRTLRASVAAAVERFNVLQLPPPGETLAAGPMELHAVINLRQAVHEAFPKIWAPEIPAPIAAVRSDWLIANLYYDHRAMAQFLNRPSILDEVHSAAHELGTLVSLGLALPGSEMGEAGIRRREYFAWLEARLLAPRLYGSPSVLVAAAESLKRFLLELRREGPAETPPAALDPWLRAFIRDLPQALGIEIGNDQEFMASIGLARTSVGSIGGHAFDRQELIRAIAQVVNGRTAEIMPLSSRDVARLDSAPDSALALTIASQTMIVPLDDEFLLLTESVVRRKELLDGHPGWFDCPAAERQAAVAAIATTEDLMQRVEMAGSWKNRSAAHFYVALGETLAERHQVSRDELMPPHLQGLLRHLRIEPTSLSPETLRSALAAGAARLVGEEGGEAAVKRLWSLPIPLSPSVLAALPTQPKERRQLLESLRKDALTPLENAHLIKLLLAGPPTAEYRRRAAALTRRVLSQSAIREWELFRRLLGWVHWQLELRDTVAWSPHTRLLAAWLHADKILHLLRAAGADVEALLRLFPRSAVQISPASFRIGEHASRDAAHPDQVSVPRLVASSIAYGWADAEPGQAASQIRSFLQALIGVKAGGRVLPNPDLLKDSNRAANGLGTYLTLDLGVGLQNFIDDTLAAHLRGAGLQHHLDDAVRAIDSGAHPDSWALVGAILGNLDPPAHLREALIRSLERVNLSGLMERDHALGLTAIGATSLQARYVPQPIKDHLKQELVAVAARAPSFAERERLALANCLLLAAFNLTVVGETDPLQASEE